MIIIIIITTIIIEIIIIIIIIIIILICMYVQHAFYIAYKRWMARLNMSVQGIRTYNKIKHKN